MIFGGRQVLAAAVLAGALLVAGVAAPQAGAVARFGDVAPARYYTDAVQWLVDEEITTGTGPGCFAPERTVTRGEAVVMMWRMVGRPAPTTNHPFSDVAKGWQVDAVAWMFENEVTTGTSATTFDPDRALTRGEFAALLHRLEGSPSADPATYVDVVRAWQVVPVGWLQAEGITTGTAPGRFSPELPLTRGMLATFLWRSRGEPAVEFDPSSPPCEGVSLGFVQRWTDGVVAVSPVISPNGRFIAYGEWFGFDLVTLPDVYMIDTLGGGSTRVTETTGDGELPIAVFDDGSVAYGSFSDTAFIYDPVTTASTEVGLPGLLLPARTTTLLAISRDRSSAVFVEDGASSLSHVDYGSSTVTEIAIPGRDLSNPVISADGATVVFNIFEPSGLGGESVVAGFGVWEAASGEITEFGGYGTAALAMSEDAETLLYAVTPISPGSQSEFWVLDRTTGDLTSVGEGHTAAMSGDGAVVAIAVGPLPGSEGLAVIRVADRAELFVGLADVGIGTIMALSGTGDVIAFDTDFPLDPTDRNGQPDIYTLLVH